MVFSIIPLPISREEVEGHVSQGLVYTAQREEAGGEASRLGAFAQSRDVPLVSSRSIHETTLFRAPYNW